MEGACGGAERGQASHDDARRPSCDGEDTAQAVGSVDPADGLCCLGFYSFDLLERAGQRG